MIAWICCCRRRQHLLRQTRPAGACLSLAYPSLDSFTGRGADKHISHSSVKHLRLPQRSTMETMIAVVYGHSHEEKVHVGPAVSALLPHCAERVGKQCSLAARDCSQSNNGQTQNNTYYISLGMSHVRGVYKHSARRFQAQCKAISRDAERLPETIRPVRTALISHPECGQRSRILPFRVFTAYFHS